MAMQIEKEHTRTFYLPLTEFELGALISSARWAVEGTKEEFAAVTVSHLKRVLANYEIAESKLKEKLP